MERDFLGLHTVKQESAEEITKESASLGGSAAMQWSFPNKASGPQFLSFKGTQEGKPKTGFESLASTGLVTITTADSYDSVLRTPSSPRQKNVILEKQGGIHYTVKNYPAQTNKTVSVAMSSNLQKPFLPAVGHRLTSSSNAQTPGEVSKTGMIPAGTNVVGTTDLRSGTKTAVSSAQLTIFYAGSVYVFDDVSPEKAQAIMLLAGKGPPATSSGMSPAAPVPMPALRSSVLDGLAVSQSHSTTPCIPSAIPLASHCGSQRAGASGSRTDTTSLKQSATETSKAVIGLRSIPDTLNSSAVPQARKASLVRFLERRKGRIISTSPYVRKQSPDASENASGSAGLAINSSSSCPVPATS